MTIRPTFFVSFPRSGHHWTANNLIRYFGEGVINYCETYKQPELRMSVCPATNLEKTHDFELDVNHEGKQALVLIRKDTLYAIRSWHHLIEAKEPFCEFVAVQQRYWLKFLAKWTAPIRPDERRIVFWYEDVRANPVACLSAMIQFLSDDPLDIPRLLNAIEKGLEL